MTWDDLFFRRYDERGYNCAHFVADAWEVVTGEPLSGALRSFLAPHEARDAPLSLRRRFSALSAPVSPSVVLFRRRGGAPHVGMFWDGRVLHLQPCGVMWQPVGVAGIGFRTVTYYVENRHSD